MNSNELRNCIIKYREDNKMADYDIGLEIGISQDTVRKFRQGAEVTPRTLQKIEKFFTQDAEPMSIDEINVLKGINKTLETELESKNQMLMDAHFQHRKLADELIITQNQYNKVVEQNKDLQEAAQKTLAKILNIAKTHDMPPCLEDENCNCDICHDEITEDGKRCMQKGMREIVKLLEGK